MIVAYGGLSQESTVTLEISFLERDASHLPSFTERDRQPWKQHEYLTLLHVLEALQQISPHGAGTNAPSKYLRQSYRNLHLLVIQ